MYGAGKGNLEDPDSRLGNVMYTRGVVYGMIVVEALRVAQAKYGKGKVDDAASSCAGASSI